MSNSRKKRLLLLHGFKGTPDIPVWYKWLKEELEPRGWELMIPLLPSPAAPKVEEWNRAIENELGGDFSNVIFVGHSLGGLAALQALAAHPRDDVAKAVILMVTPVRDVGRPALLPFMPPLLWDVIKKRAAHFLHFYSDDDPYVPFDHGEELHRLLGGSLVACHGMHHFQAAPNFPAFLETLKKLG